jgi:hypothetical protein
MPWQLIYTSAPRGLLSGQSGFCTVARSADLREALVQRLEQISSYHYLRVSGGGADGGNPTISAFRILDIRGAKYQVLTRIQPCGLDFTARTNHLAHHLIFQPEELAQLPSPAAILRGWKGWSAGWQGDPRLLDEVPLDEFREIKRPTFPAQTWLQITGDAGRAAGLLESECVRGCYLVCPPGGERQLLDMFAETLQLLDHTGQYPLRPWRYSFTTFMQAEDNPLDFQWRGCQEGTPAYLEAAQHSAPMLALRSVRVPANAMVRIARESPRPAAAPAGSAPRSAVTLVRREPFASGKSPPPVYDATHLRGATGPGERYRFLNMNLWIDSSTMARLAIFVAVLLVLIGARIWINRHRVAVDNRPPVLAEAPPAAQDAPAPKPVPPPVVSAPLVASASPIASAPPVDLKGLDALWADGPTYLVLTSNVSRFALPIQDNSRFQNLIRRYDSFNPPQGPVKLMLSADRWNLSSEAPLDVRATPAKEIAAGNGDEQCVFDYSEWLPQHDVVRTNAPIIVRMSFTKAPSLVSARFSFSSTSDGYPFRLLIVDPAAQPTPLRMARSFLVMGAANSALEQRLSQIHLLGGATLRYRPFVKTKDHARYLYEDWPQEELPPPDAQLDFPRVKESITKRQDRLVKRAAAWKRELDNPQKVGFDRDFGGVLKSSDQHLATFAEFAGTDFSASRFIEYLEQFKKEGARHLGGWPNFRNADPADLPVKFERLYDVLTNKFPDRAQDLAIDNTNYFYATWTNLTSIDTVRQEAGRAEDELNRVGERLASVPDGVDGTAYVGLFIVEPQDAQARVEMIRFQ